jgi:carbonic anhydrase
VSNPFFKFLDDKTQPIDLSLLMPLDFSLHSYVMGYVGTNTVPNCERGQCWYFVKDVQSITQDQLNKLMVSGVKSNNRHVQERQKAYKQYDAQGMNW